MCGIFLYYNNEKFTEDFYSDVIYKEFMKGQHRGPENSQTLLYNNYYFGFHRLAINGLDDISNQPFDIDDVILLCNGEIYNHTELTEKLKKLCFQLLGLEHDFYLLLKQCQRNYFQLLINL